MARRVHAEIRHHARDVRHITGMAFPVFANGVSPVDATGRLRVYACRCAIECGGVLVEPGDIIFGAADGVVVIPQDMAVETVGEARHRVEEVRRLAARCLCQVWHTLNAEEAAAIGAYVTA